MCSGQETKYKYGLCTVLKVILASFLSLVFILAVVIFQGCVLFSNYVISVQYIVVI